MRDTVPNVEAAFATMAVSLVGEALAEKQVQLTHVYSSPSVRCVQTGAEILQSERLYNVGPRG